MNPQENPCIESCWECSRTCLETIPYCVNQGGEHADPAHINLMKDCANICETSAKLMMNDSEFQFEIGNICADICERCAQDCDQFQNDRTMHECAEVCRKCAKSCREMSSKKMSQRAA